jgi:ubiquinone biosynthesis accessory factor UbiK
MPGRRAAVVAAQWDDPTEPAPMIDLKTIDDLARRLSDLVPPGLKEARGDLERNFRSTLQAGLGRLDLVTREEFEVQRAVLLRTREKVDALERALAAREAGEAAPGDAAH